MVVEKTMQQLRYSSMLGLWQLGNMKGFRGSMYKHAVSIFNLAQLQQLSKILPWQQNQLEHEHIAGIRHTPSPRIPCTGTGYSAISQPFENSNGIEHTFDHLF
jgi:hypothetical protein